MQCKNCGKRLKTKELFCPSCGYYNGDVNNVSWDNNIDLLKDDKTEQTTDIIDRSNTTDTTQKEEYSYEDEDLLEAFIGEDYKIIKKHTFNIWALFFGWVYFIYRKLYVIGTLGLALTLAVLMLFSKIFIFYLILVMFACGFIFNPVYIFIAKKKIEIIKLDNPDSDRYTLSNIAMSKGGVNLPVALIIYFVFMVVLFFMMITIYYNKDHNTKYWEENSENQATCINLIKIAYNNIEEEYNLGEISDAACKVYKTTSREYEVYLKTIKDNQYIYTMYKTENDYLKYENNTEQLNELEIKKTNSSLTAEEKNIYIVIKGIESNYQDIINKSKKEEELIKTKKNNSARTSFTFSKEEIIR
jgi:hypothetical protein